MISERHSTANVHQRRSAATSSPIGPLVVVGRARGGRVRCGIGRGCTGHYRISSENLWSCSGEVRYCSPVAKTYDQYCPVAVTLDLVGERWTLLIIRELLGGPLRYTDLQSVLKGIPPNLLADRLRDLEAHGLVEKQTLPPPAARSVFAL